VLQPGRKKKMNEPHQPLCSFLRPSQTGDEILSQKLFYVLSNNKEDESQAPRSGVKSLAYVFLLLESYFGVLL